MTIIQNAELIGITVETNPAPGPEYWFYSYTSYQPITSSMDISNDAYISIGGTGNGIQKISTTGVSQARAFNGSASVIELDVGAGMRVDSGGNIFGTATATSNIRYGKINNGLNAVYFCKEIYQLAGGSSGNSESVQDLILDTDESNFFLCGSGRDANNNGQMAAFKVDAYTGNVVWAKTYASIPNSNSFGSLSKMDLTSGGDLWIAGAVADPNQTSFDSASLALLKIDKSTGSIATQYIYSATTNQAERGRTMCVDSTGNIIVAGAAGDTGLIMKVYPGNGAIAWQQRTTGFTDFWGIDTDSSDNIYVGFTGGQRPIAKLYSSNGNIVWSNKITVAGTNASFENLEVAGNALYAYGIGISARTLLAKLPLDGSGLGTYTAAAGNIVYQAQANVFSPGNLSLVNANLATFDFGALSSNINSVTFFSNTNITNSTLNTF